MAGTARQALRSTEVTSLYDDTFPSFLPHLSFSLISPEIYKRVNEANCIEGPATVALHLQKEKKKNQAAKGDLPLPYFHSDVG